MARPVWKGHVSFGMVSIPVALFPADRPDDLSFELLDDRDLAPVGYRKVNKKSGGEVPPDHLVRGFRLDDGQVVVVNDEDLKKASPERTQTLDLRGFVDQAQVPPLYFERPYYLQPTPAGLKGYALLREAMAASKKAAVGTVVLRARQHLALLFPDGPRLVLNTLRYPNELKDPKEIDLPIKSPQELGLSDKELRMAQRLVEEMVEPWEPEKYHDEYRDDLLAAIRRKAESGEARPAAQIGEPAEPGKGKVTDMMTLLKKSVARAAADKPRRPRTA